MLKVNVNELGAGLLLEKSVSANSFPELKEMQQAGEMSFNKPLDFRLELKRYGDDIVVAGSLRGEVILNCGRCLNDYPQIITGDFSLRALPEPEFTPEYAQETMLNDGDLDNFTYTGNTLDLREVLQEQVILSLPLAPLCKEECRGLCMSCGADLNREACGCDAKAAHPAFAALKDLKL